MSAEGVPEGLYSHASVSFFDGENVITVSWQISFEHAEVVRDMLTANLGEAQNSTMIPAAEFIAIARQAMSNPETGMVVL